MAPGLFCVCKGDLANNIATDAANAQPWTCVLPCQPR
ncbi:MAG: hypothetical protein KDI07_07175 [Anaerolineae bacterium]|nr:hypothetical protein [Anaerolineae bacterium]MCB9132208.1 hypothetical protein [Anaerolineales bacterium]MCB0228458.1 hypothetical protein [Anaerolineae bacterium]MCB0234498.1 hypothetical protein [Anaerolineae bacterium]MCB0237271.1 hypothetical protein [Anaerolineae bacterium]